MKSRLCLFLMMLAGITVATAQVASHAPALKTPAAPAPAASASTVTTPPVSMKAVVKVNGAVLTDVDVLREMYAIFPYAQQHNGFPKNMESEIRKGATEMVIFEELLYQEAKRRKMTIAPEVLARNEAAFRKQFPDKAAYDGYLKMMVNGSKTAMREKIQRSLLIEQMLKTEVNAKSVVPLAVAKEYYDKNSKQFEHGETISFQTISITPPANAPQKVKDEAKAKIKDIVRIGRAAKTSRDFGLLAEQISEDDWRTKLGDRGTVDVRNLPPEITKAARAMKPGTVSDPIQLDRAWVVIRLNAHTLAGKTPFSQAKAKLLSDLKKQKTSEVRSALNKKLSKDAKIEVL